MTTSRLFSSFPSSTATKAAMLPPLHSPKQKEKHLLVCLFFLSGGGRDDVRELENCSSPNCTTTTTTTTTRVVVRHWSRLRCRSVWRGEGGWRPHPHYSTKNKNGDIPTLRMAAVIISLKDMVLVSIITAVKGVCGELLMLEMLVMSVMLVFVVQVVFVVKSI